MLSKLPDIRLSLLGKDLVPAKAVKDLGVTLDRNLTLYLFIYEITETKVIITVENIQAKK